jgi:hypothetical protein
MTRWIITILMAGVSWTAHAQEMSTIPSLPPQGMGSTFVAPAEDQDEDGDADEWQTDMNDFLGQGYTIPHWDTYSKYVEEIANDLVIPEYLRRTGKLRPKFPSIDVAAAMITHGDYNDLIVRSRLPGDCTDQGCLVQIYSLVGSMWIKKYEFRSLEFAYKDGKINGTTLLGAVGNEYVPSRIITWNGSSFQE